eukprot:Opistho-2@12319
MHIRRWRRHDRRLTRNECQRRSRRRRDNGVRGRDVRAASPRAPCRVSADKRRVIIHREIASLDRVETKLLLLLTKVIAQYRHVECQGRQQVERGAQLRLQRAYVILVCLFRVRNQRHGAHPGEPVEIVDGNHIAHIRFLSVKLGPLLLAEMHNEVEIIPQVVFNAYVLLERHGLVVKRTPIQPADKARVLAVFLTFVLFRTEIGKGVDDHTEDEIENNDNDNEEEQQIVEYADKIERFVLGFLHKNIANAASIAQPQVQRRDDAVQHCIARPLGSHRLRVNQKVVPQIQKAEYGEHVYDDECKYGRQHDRLSVSGNRANHILQRFLADDNIEKQEGVQKGTKHHPREAHAQIPNVVDERHVLCEAILLPEECAVVAEIADQHHKRH